MVSGKPRKGNAFLSKSFIEGMHERKCPTHHGTAWDQESSAGCCQQIIVQLITLQQIPFSVDSSEPGLASPVLERRLAKQTPGSAEGAMKAGSHQRWL